MPATFHKLKFFLADNALFHFFNNEYWSADEVKFIHNLCLSSDSDNFRKLRLRLLCEENNDIIVASVLADASPDEFTFLKDRYFYRFSFTKISLNLHVHVNGLQRWRDKFLADISSLLEYKLPVSDIFSRNKIEALIFVLERSIVFHETYGNSDQSFLTSLKLKLNFYQNLLFALRQFLDSDSKHIGVRVIQAKILNRQMSCEELEKSLGVSHTTVSHYVRVFRYKYFHNNFESHK